jgi:hypothetical protein
VKFKYKVEGTYEVDDSRLLECYGTTDPIECAKIDSQNNPEDMLGLLDSVKTQIIPVKS